MFPNLCLSEAEVGNRTWKGHCSGCTVRDTGCMSGCCCTCFVGVAGDGKDNHEGRKAKSLAPAHIEDECH